MKLAIYADSKGKIAGLAVCQITFNNKLGGPKEISLRAEPISGISDAADTSDIYKTHFIDLPPHLVDKPHYELAQALQDIHASMYLDLTQSRPYLCKHGSVKEKSETK